MKAEQKIFEETMAKISPNLKNKTKKLYTFEKLDKLQVGKTQRDPQQTHPSKNAERQRQRKKSLKQLEKNEPSPTR